MKLTTSTRRITYTILVTLFALLLGTLAAPGLAQKTPASVRLGALDLDSIEPLRLEGMNNKTLRDQEEALRQKESPRPLAFAAPHEVAIDSGVAGAWEELADGSHLYRLRIVSADALSLNLGFSTFELAEGAQLWLYDPALDLVQGPYTSANRSRHGRFYSPVVEGDEIVVEIHEPNGRESHFVIEKVNHGFYDLRRPFLKQGACNIDVVCPEVDPYRDQVRAVARYTIGGIGACTGTIINNTAEDFRPLFLTADHCGINATNDDTLVAYWNYESPSCGQLSGGSLDDNQSGSTFLSSDPDIDFALVELDQMPSSGSNVFYSGWDASGTIPPSTFGIHHPSADEKSFASDFEAPIPDEFFIAGADTHWRVDDWDLGTTEPGSSGSCLFNQASQQCIGVLTGGFAACGNDLADWYGNLAQGWNGATASTRLSDWLDPVDGGATNSLAGIDANGGGNGGQQCPGNTNIMTALGGRFTVEAVWRNFQNQSGQGCTTTTIDLGDTSDVFYFFAPGNQEILVKVLDACNSEFNSFWVFAAATTNVEYTLTVTDTQTNTVKTYFNPLGNAAAAITDTSAFATCP